MAPYPRDSSTRPRPIANGSLHPLGEVRPPKIEIPNPVGTGQQIAFELVAKRVCVSNQVEGIDLQGALEAAGASEAGTTSVAAAMSRGEALFGGGFGGG